MLSLLATTYNLHHITTSFFLIGKPYKTSKKHIFCFIWGHIHWCWRLLHALCSVITLGGVQGIRPRPPICKHGSTHATTFQPLKHMILIFYFISFSPSFPFVVWSYDVWSWHIWKMGVTMAVLRLELTATGTQHRYVPVTHIPGPNSQSLTTFLWSIQWHCMHSYYFATRTPSICGTFRHP